MRAGRRRGGGEGRAEDERVTRERGWSRRVAEPHLLSGSRLPGLSSVQAPIPTKALQTLGVRHS